MTEQLLVARQCLLQTPLECHALLLGNLQSRLRLQHVNRDPRAPLNPLVLKPQLRADRVLRVLRNRDQTHIAQHVQILVQTLEQQLLARVLKAHLLFDVPQLRRRDSRLVPKSVEKVLRRRQGQLVAPHQERPQAAQPCPSAPRPCRPKPQIAAGTPPALPRSAPAPLKPHCAPGANPGAPEAEDEAPFQAVRPMPDT